MKTKIFGGNKKFLSLEEEVNKWLEDNRETKVIDIKFGYSADGSVGWYSAMVLYEDDYTL